MKTNQTVEGRESRVESQPDGSPLLFRPRPSTFNPVKGRGPHGALRPQPSTCFVIAHTHIPSGEHFARLSVIPHDAEAFARAIYAELHGCDEAGAEWIIVEAPPELPEWSGIADRLKRAAA